MVLRIQLMTVILTCLLLFTGCSQEEAPVQVDISKKEQAGFDEKSKVINYAYLPQYSQKVSYLRHHLLIEYLRKETGLMIKQVFPNTFDEHIEMVGQGKIDISYSNPFVYIKIAQRYGAKAFCRVVESDGRKNFRGQIICRVDNSKVQSFEDYRGKRWIAVDPSSAGGYLYPLYYFLTHGIQKEDFSAIDFALGPGGQQEKVVLSVYEGKYDLGSIREGTLTVVADRIDINQIRVLANTPWFPGWVYAARVGLEQEIVEKIKSAFLKLDYNQGDQRDILEAANIVGIISSDDNDFNLVRELAANLGEKM